ncbi:MAG TPA: MopE-related protein [Chitinophagales bacterium]|nr:MopE-related protein [Chitinophagales bacterium]
MKKSYLLLTFALASVFSVSKAQVYAYLDDPTGAYAGVATNATGTNLSRENCLLADPACGVGYSSNKHTTSGYTNGRPSVQFSVTPDAGYQLDVTSISVDIRRNPKGPEFWRIAYSTDGGASWTNSGTDFSVAASGCFTNTNLTWDVADFSTTSTLTVRIIGHTAYSSLNGISTLKNIDVAGTVSFADADGDGYASNVDCNDADAAINPGATEICDGIDNNCDGNIDEAGGATWYADADGDTYGDAASTTVSCDVPVGYVADNTDCNDGDAAINPAATEVCDGVDNNCDGNIDEGIDLSISITPSGVIELCKPDDVTLSAVGTFDSYQWYKNGAPLTGETGATYTTNKPAYYQVEGFIGTCSSGLSEVQAVAVYESPNANITYPDGLNLCFADPLLLKASYDATYTYVWYLDGIEIVGATIANYEATATGDYYCVITSVDGCVRTTATVTVINECREGVAANAAIAVYPNPANDVLAINLTGLESNATANISITDITGKVVYTTAIATGNGSVVANVSLDNNVVSGLYFVTAEVNGTSMKQQFVVIK